MRMGVAKNAQRAAVRSRPFEEESAVPMEGAKNAQKTAAKGRL